MAREPRVVAELGRPETAQETADRKAASSAAYRSSKTARNLVAALLVTLAVVLVIVFAVPRGQAPPANDIDVPALAGTASSSYDRPIVAPAVPDGWRVNGAAVSGNRVLEWTVVLAPPERGFLRVSQGFDADAAWTASLLGGAEPTGTVVLDGVEWTRYEISDAARDRNVTIAFETALGDDRVAVYGSTPAEEAEAVARALAPQITAARADLGTRSGDAGGKAQ